MEKSNYYWISIIFLIILIVVFGILINSKKIEASPNSLNCNTLKFSNEKSINIAFLGDLNKAKEYTELLLETSPFKENQEAFNFYQVDGSPECELYKGIAILCTSKTNLRMVSSCPSDYIVVIDKKPIQIRSSTYKNIMSLNSATPNTVFLHEFGHAFADFAEEYLSNTLSFGQRNCKSSPSNFEFPTDGEFEECSYPDYYRSIDNGVMRTLSTTNFGSYDEEILLERISDEFGYSNPLNSKVFLSPEECKNNEFVILNTETGDSEVFSGCTPGNGFGSKQFKILKDDKEILSEDYNNYIFTDGLELEYNLEGETYQDSSKEFITFSYDSKGNQIQILDELGNLEKTFDSRIIGGVPCKR